MGEIWILGASGRCGRAITHHLAGAGLSPVLVGRDGMGLRNLAATVGDDTRVVTVETIEDIASEIIRNVPKVVVNTIGPFDKSALPIAQACPSGTHYVDVSNEVSSILAILELDATAKLADRTLVTGAGFGVLATECVVMRLCANHPGAQRIRAATMPVMAATSFRIGSAMAGSIISGLSRGGLQYAEAQLTHMPAFGDTEVLSLPDGTQVETVAVPSGELIAAQRASGAAFVVAASNLVPGTALWRRLLPIAARLCWIPTVRNVVSRLLAEVTLRRQSALATNSWAHARAEWPSGAIRQGWLRTGEAMAFTATVAAEIVLRLARDEGYPGAYTPGALFGPDLVLRAGGKFLLDGEEG
jgi:short subunit dehydrogenase-like uncharacterized protein